MKDIFLKELENPSAYIYMLKNKTTGKVYIGQTLNIEDRWNTHKRGLEDFSHKNSEMALDSFLFGYESFEFFILKDLGENDDVLQTESGFIEFFESTYPKGYNLPAGKSYGKQFTLKNLFRREFSEIEKIKDERCKNKEFLDLFYDEIFGIGEKKLKIIFSNLIVQKRASEEINNCRYNTGKISISKMLENIGEKELRIDDKEFSEILLEFSIRRKIQRNSSLIDIFLNWANSSNLKYHIFLVENGDGEGNTFIHILKKDGEKEFHNKKMSFLEIIEAYSGRKLFGDEIIQLRKKLINYVYMPKKRINYSRMGKGIINAHLENFNIPYHVKSGQETSGENRKKTYWVVLPDDEVGLNK